MNETYTKKWQLVEAALEKDLYKTAEKEIVQILQIAKQEANTEQIVKAICYYRKCVTRIDEESSKEDILFFSKECEAAGFPLKQILHSMIAEMTWKHYEGNKWQILERTNIQGENKEINLHEIDSWSAQDYNQFISTHYHLSLEPAVSLQNQSVNNFPLLIEKGKNTIHLRPTLFDFLAHRAIAYYQNPENEITQASYAFEIKDSRAFSIVNQFCTTEFETSDTTSKKFQVLAIYKTILSFHLNNKNFPALIDADIHRLYYVYAFSIHPQKRSLYLEALEHIAKTYASFRESGMALYTVAQSLTQIDQPYQQPRQTGIGNERIKADNPKAKKMLEEIIAAFPKSEAAYQAEILLSQIQEHFLSLQNEQIVLPNQPSLALLRFKNVPVVHCKIVALSMNEWMEKMEYNHTSSLSYASKNAIQTWSIELPRTEDFLQHTTEIALKPLPMGNYVILLSEDDAFSDKENLVFAYMQVSNIAFVSANYSDVTKLNMQRNASDWYLMNRTTGEPLENAKVKTWQRNYDYTTRKESWKNGKIYTSNKDGLIAFGKEEQHNVFYPEIIVGEDKLFVQSGIQSYSEQHKLHETQRTFLFTDRSIYRPGQTVFFKGIIVDSKGYKNKEHSLVANKSIRVGFYDMHHQMLKDEEFFSNNFGSFHGKFIIPEGGMNGIFSILTENGVAQVQVEEYKRPKFEVLFDTVHSAYSLHESITVNVSAKAYAGNSISDAKVRYRVYRTTRFPYYWCFYRWGQPASPEMEIVHGSLTTDKEGKFSIPFTALPDETIPTSTMPIFDYRIVADVTDLNGETHSNTTQISVSYQAYQIKIEAPEKVDRNYTQVYKIQTTNLQGTFVAIPVTVTCKKLKAPTKTLRARLWAKPDIYTISKSEFSKLFPEDEYNNENDYMQWEMEREVWSEQMITTQEGFMPNHLPEEQGWYVLEVSYTDKNGEKLVEKKYIRQTDGKQPVILPNEHLFVTHVPTKYLPNETVKVSIGTPYEKLWVLLLTNRNEVSKEWLQVERIKNVSFALTENDRGGFYLTGVSVKNNRVYTLSEFIDVPYTNKELDIQIETFRDKMLPGSKQEWKLKIRGSQKEKVGAEILASMYDASLDAFSNHPIPTLDLFTNNFNHVQWNTYYGFTISYGQTNYRRNYEAIKPYEKVYDALVWWGMEFGNVGIVMEADNPFAAPMANVKGIRTKMMAAKSEDAMQMDESLKNVMTDDVAGGSKQLDSSSPSFTKNSPIPFRKNFKETAFFYPQLQTDADGNVVLAFEAPEALTRWKLHVLGHTKDLAIGNFSIESTTQKEVMIVPQTPRFLREGDKIQYAAKVTNLSSKEIIGIAKLDILDVVGDEKLNALFANQVNEKAFTLQKGESTLINWELLIPLGYSNPVIVQTFAGAKDKLGKETFSDGEQNVLPILSNRMLVTETFPLPVRWNSKKNFSFDKLGQAKNSATLKHHNVSVEFTSNPSWYALQALSYLSNYPYDCSEQTFNRYYANVMAHHIVHTNPAIQSVYQKWKENPSNTLSPLEKNQELKSILLAETPWVLEAISAKQQEEQLATLFDSERMAKELERNIRELKILQTPNGGFSWFKGMPEDRFITQYILTGIGRLQHLGMREMGSAQRVEEMMQAALQYADARLQEDYDKMLREKLNLQEQRISSMQIQYVYMRSYFLEQPIPSEMKKAFDYYVRQIEKQWTKQPVGMQAMMALVLLRYDKRATALDILKSLREQAIRKEEMGMYWKSVNNSYFWYEAPIETQCVLIEAFKEVGNVQQEVDELKIWLLKNKQTQHWKTTKATADACYALLIEGSNWLQHEPDIQLSLGNSTILSKEMDKVAGTGYFKINYAANQIQAEMANIEVKIDGDVRQERPSSGVSWGAMYWQYFEDLDKITTSETPLKIKKKLFLEKNSDRGLVLAPITNKESLQVGDKVIVRIELSADRDMEYVHMKDMRASCFEPTNVISNYKYQGGLGYYESTKDVCTNFFFNWLPKGNYIFEYPMFVTNKGVFSNGITTIQCMYAPEFSSHSEGIRVEVK